jgi:thiamine transport system substrate-binding protein
MKPSRILIFGFVFAGMVSSCSSKADQPAQPTTPIATLIVVGESGVTSEGLPVSGDVTTTAATLDEPPTPVTPTTTVLVEKSTAPTVVGPAPQAPAVIGADGSAVAGVTLPPLSASPSPATSVVTNVNPVGAAPATGVTLTLLTYDSFALSKGLLEGFTASTGIGVEVKNGGDSGRVARSLVANRATPQADVVWGLGATNLQTAYAGAVLYPYMARTRSDMPSAFTKLVPNNEATPVAYRDVCVNYDKAFLSEQKLRTPMSFEDLVKPEFKGKFVVENPSTSATGLAFLLATISHFGPTGWQPYWIALKANEVKVVDSWAEAYQSNFTAGNPASLAPGTFPFVVSYGSSPASAVALSANPAATEAPTGVIESTCVRDVEFAAIVIGTRHQAEATQLMEFLSSVPVQEDVPLSMSIYPAHTKARLPKTFTDFALLPATPIMLDPKQTDTNKNLWVNQWLTLMR